MANTYISVTARVCMGGGGGGAGGVGGVVGGGVGVDVGCGKCRE